MFLACDVLKREKQKTALMWARSKYEYVFFSGTKPKCKRTNVKQVVTMSIHYIKDKIKKLLGIIKYSRTKIGPTKKIVI